MTSHDAEDPIRTTVTLPDELVKGAMELTGIADRVQLIRRAMETLVQVEAGRRVIAMGGSDPAAAAGADGRGEPTPEWIRIHREQGIE